MDAGDTIVAIATPPGRGAIGVVRVSGPEVLTLAQGLLGRVPPPRHASLCRFVEADGEVIDEGIAIVFKAPASFTGEDMLELYAHGSPVVLDRLVARLAVLGARPAGPGEFSRRAFENGQYDLAQLEAIADLIASTGAAAARCAQRSLQGEFSAQVQTLCDALAELRARIEASIDFSDEDVDLVPGAEIGKALADLSARLADLHRRARKGAVLRAGAEIVIAGQPNVGKSSLLNRLAGCEEAIVSATAGTTRDVLKSDVLIGGVPVRILDTAGLRASGDEIEQEGVRRARTACRTADLVLVVVDARVGMEPFEREWVAGLEAGDVPWLAVHNKCDLVAPPRHYCEKPVPGLSGDGDSVKLQEQVGAAADGVPHVSAKTGEGIDALAARITARLSGDAAGDAEDAIIARRRHLIALTDAERALERAKDQLPTDALELVAEELRVAQQMLGTITGARTTEDLLGDIFSRFCIGK